MIARLAGWCERPGGAFLFIIPIALDELLLKRIWPGELRGGHLSYLLMFFLFGYLLMGDYHLTGSVRRHGRRVGPG
jgi:hypothetical protein